MQALATKPKRTALSIAQRGDIVKKLRCGTPIAHLATEYGCSRSAISNIKNSQTTQQDIMDKLDSLPLLRAATTKRMQSGQFRELEESLWEWCTRAKARGIPLSQDILATKAQ